MNRHGSCVRIQAAADLFFSGTGNSIISTGCEGGDQMFYFEKNPAQGGSDEGYINDWVFTNNTHVRAWGRFLCTAQDKTVMYRDVFTSNLATEPQEDSSFYDIDSATIYDYNLGDLLGSG